MALRAIKGGKLAATKRLDKAPPRPANAAAAPDDMPLIALHLPPAKLSPAMDAYFRKCEEKLGFVPNGLRLRHDETRNFRRHVQ
jgi:hypothetical protein